MRKSWTVGLLLWLGVVVVASALTWTVINAAGDQVLTDNTPVPIPAAVAEPPQSVQPTQSIAGARHHPHASGRPHQHPSTTAPSQGTSGSGAPPSAAPPQPPSPTPAYQERTWRDAPGWVTVGCTGSRSSLVATTPSDGYGVEVGSRGPGEVEVTFKSNGGQTQVQAACSGGVPRFVVENDASAPGDE